MGGIQDKSGGLDRAVMPTQEEKTRKNTTCILKSSKTSSSTQSARKDIGSGLLKAWTQWKLGQKSVSVDVSESGLSH